MIDTDAETLTLTETLIHEMTKAFALPQTSFAHSFIRLLFGSAARAAARVGIGLDQAVAEDGLAGGARWILPRFVKSHQAHGTENIPARGPLVIASNHPASVDSIVISAYVGRPDYKVIIGEIPFFRNLPNISRSAVFAPVESDLMGRMQAVRDMIRHLKNDGAILIFPRGNIEADPAWMPHPEAEFDHWSRSLEIFLKQVPHTQVLITIVSGVISKAAMQHPITWFRKERPDRQRLAFMYQMIRQMISGKETFGLTPRVTFGDLVSVENTSNRERMLQTITQSAYTVLKHHMTPGDLAQV